VEQLLLDKQFCKISTVVEAAVEESSILISENGISLEVIDNSEGNCVCGDLCRLTQVVCNLLNNAAKYGSCGGKILVDLDVRGDLAFIRIKDDGIGIAPERLVDIFEMFTQVQCAIGRGAAGLGIGLALVRSLVKLHGGTVEVHSDGLNCGSTFTVSLPLVRGICSEHALPKVVSNNSSRLFRVLVVDDMRAMRFVTKRLLEKLGHEVQVAENGQQALKKLDSFTPEVVFSDITMPVMNGHELVRQIRERKELENICMVALTGYGQSSDQEMAFEAGFDRHLTKPVDFQRRHRTPNCAG
jgi:CheY-like chemotaxis protein